MNIATKTILAVLLGTTSLVGCATVDKMDQPTYERLASQAKAAMAESDAVKYTWTTSEDAMAKAEEAARQGNWETAIKQVKRAKEQSELAYKQYQQEQNSTPVLD